MKMKLKALLILISMFAFIFAAGCSEDEDPLNPGDGDGSPNASGSITLNGAGYDNRTINIVTGAAAFDIENQQTGAVLYGNINNDTLYVSLKFDGNTAGNYPWQSAFNDSLLGSTGVALFIGMATNNYFIPKQGVTNITKYEAIGGTIEGNFNGVLQNALTQDSINVSCSFVVPRLPDDKEIGDDF